MRTARSMQIILWGSQMPVSISPMSTIHSVHLKFSSISCFPYQCHVPTQSSLHAREHRYWSVAKQQEPFFPTRCHCSRIGSIQLWNSPLYCGDFSISKGIPEGSATGCFWTSITRSNLLLSQHKTWRHAYFLNIARTGVWSSGFETRTRLDISSCCLTSSLRGQ
jgi:hypothetical protein